MISLPGRLMRSRLFKLLSCFLLSAAAVQSAQAVDLSTQRQYYDEAKRALAMAAPSAPEQTTAMSSTTIQRRHP